MKKKTDQQAKIDKLAWLAGAWEYSKHRDLGGGCAPLYDQTDSSINLHPDHENGIMVGTLRISYVLDAIVSDPAHCNRLAKRQEMTLEYNVGVKISEDMHGGFAVVGIFVSCSGNHCKDVDKTNTAGYVAKNENGFEIPSYFVSPAGHGGNLEFHRSN